MSPMELFLYVLAGGGALLLLLLAGSVTFLVLVALAESLASDDGPRPIPPPRLKASR